MMEQRTETNTRRALSLLTGWLAVAMLSSCAQIAPEAPSHEDNFQAFEGRRISGIQVKYLGGETVDREKLLNLMASEVGESFSAAKLDEDTKVLYASGLVDDLRFIPVADGRKVRHTVEVQTRPPVGPMFCSGNVVFSDQKLVKACGIKVRTKLSPEWISHTCRSIERFYWHHGYRQCQVTYGPGPWKATSPDDYMFLIEEGSEFRTMKRKPWLGINR